MDVEPIIIEPEGTAQWSVIWLHGLGADGNDFVPIVRELRLPESAAARFVFPNAPMMPVTVNAGYLMPAWYDIAVPDLTQQVDEAGIEQSVDELKTLIEREIAGGIPLQKIVLAGFSQGGVIALRTALSLSQPPAGVMALSTYLPVRRQQDQTGLDIFWGHGELDDIAPLSIASEARDYLQSSGNQVNWNTYPMQHSVCAQEIQDIRRWLLGLMQ